MTTTPIPVVAWMTDDGRVATNETKQCMPRASKENFNEPLCKVSYTRAAIESATEQGKPQWLPIADDHKGMRVDYSGLFMQSRNALSREPGLAEMLRQLQGHLQELGQRWYAGDTAVVDEVLQLYCIESDARAKLVAALPPTATPQGNHD